MKFAAAKKALLTEVSAELVRGVSSQDMLNSAAFKSGVWSLAPVTWECITFQGGFMES